MKRSFLVDLFWKIHPPLYRATRGRLLGRLQNMPVLLLTTTGRRTRTPRTTALTYFESDGAWVVIGTFLGEPRDPGWVWNLRAEPAARVQVGARTHAVRGREADGEERQRLWDEVCSREPSYASYAGRTTRRIPILVLEPSG